MKRYVLYTLTLLALLVGTVAGALAVSGGDSIDYPNFDRQPEPQVIVRAERDFAYRTGDPIRFTVFVDQAKGTVVDGLSFAVTDTNDGDMELTSALLGSKSLSDGEKILAVQVTLRKWSYEQTFSVRATMSYIVSESGDTNALSVPEITLHMSPTWDGRKTLNQGDSKLRGDTRPYLNVVLVGTGLILSLFSWLFIRSARRKNSRIRSARPRVKSALELAREGFELRRDLILGRDFRLEHYEELERIVRGLFDIETQTTDQVMARLGSERSWAQDDVLSILEGCDKRLYQDCTLTEGEHTSIFSAFEHLLEQMPLHETAPPPRITRWTPLTSRLKRLPHRKLAFLAVASKWLWRHRPFRYYV